MVFKTGQESESKDAKLCKTVDDLIAFRCPQIIAHPESILKHYKKYTDAERLMLTDRALREASKGKVYGDMTMYVAIGDATGTFPYALVKKGGLFQRVPMTLDEQDSVGVYEVILHFVMNPDVAFYRKEKDGKLRIKLDEAEFADETHAAMLIIDKTHLTADYSDPQGHTPWNKAVYAELRKVVNKEIHLLPPWDTCPVEGVQHVLKEGLCGYFAGLYAFLRLRCPHVSPLHLQTHLVGLGRGYLLRLVRGWACYLRTLDT